MGSHSVSMYSDDTSSLPLKLFMPDPAIIRIFDKLHKKARQGLTKKQHNVAGTFMNVFMFYVTTSMLLIGHKSIVPYFFDQYGAWNSYYMKLFITFVYIQAWANWICVKYYHSIFVDEREMDETRFNYAYSTPTEPKKLISPLGLPLQEDINSLLHRERSVLSWTWCHECERLKPPRAHHCTICKRCILKRDHHCYLTNTCIGFYNQRYFTVLTFYITLACYGGLGFGVAYMYKEYWAKTTASDYFPPLALYRCFFQGKYPLEFSVMTSLLFILPCVGSMCLAFFFYQLMLICIGKTPFEFLKDLHLRNTSTCLNNFNSVFGKYCLLNWLMPLQLFCPQEGNPREWPNLKIVYKRVKKRSYAPEIV